MGNSSCRWVFLIGLLGSIGLALMSGTVSGAQQKRPPSAGPNSAERPAPPAQRSAPATQRPAPAAPDPDEYRLGPEDVLDVFVWKEPDLTTAATVRPDGKISVPLIGDLPASGRTASQLQQEITKRLSHFVSEPVVTVIVKQFNSFTIPVLGEVRRPDVYKVSRKITVLDAIALAGGFTEFAKKDHVIVIRKSSSGEQRITINLKKYLKDGTGEPFYLKPSDVVFVE